VFCERRLDAVLEVGQLGDVRPGRAFQGRGELERDVLGYPLPDITNDDVGGKTPGVVRIDYDLRTMLIVTCLSHLPW